MPADVHRVRYVLPKFSKRDYALWMKTFHNCLTFDTSDVAKFRLHVLDHCAAYGWRSACAAFNVKKSTLYDWKKRFEDSGKRLFSLVPKKTRPKRVRQMMVDSRLTAFIKATREQYGHVSKYKLKILLDAYVANLGIVSIGFTAIGKIIKRNHFFFEGRKKIRRRSHLTNQPRVKRAPKETKPGYLEMDSITIWVAGVRHYFINVIDIAAKIAWSKEVPSLTAKQAKISLSEFQGQYHYPLHTVQTDNGSEFLGEFHHYLEQERINHAFIYPRSPRINGIIERFNRTLEEEFLERSEELLDESPKFSQKLQNYLIWYNEKRPHASLNYQTPLAILQTYFSEM